MAKKKHKKGPSTKVLQQLRKTLRRGMRLVVGVASGSSLLGKKAPMLGRERGDSIVYGIFCLLLPECLLMPNRNA